MIYVRNVRDFHVKMDGLAIYLGRPSSLSNPYTVDADGDRDEVIAKFADWFYAVVACRDESPARRLLEQIVNLSASRRMSRTKHLYLLCWCAPKDCHCDIIKEYLEK